MTGRVRRLVVTLALSGALIGVTAPAASMVTGGTDVPAPTTTPPAFPA